MRNEAAVRGLLGLCQRAGRLQSGTDMAIAAVRGGKGCLLLADAAAAENAMKKIMDAGIYYHVPCLVLPQGLLGQAVGHEERMAAAVTDPGFARKLQMLTAEDP